MQGDTLSSGFEAGASGQRLTTTIGQAIADAAGKMKEVLAALAAERLNCAPSDVRMGEDGSFSAVGDDDRPCVAHGLGRVTRQGALQLPRARTRPASRTT